MKYFCGLMNLLRFPKTSKKEEPTPKWLTDGQEWLEENADQVFAGMSLDQETQEPPINQDNPVE